MVPGIGGHPTIWVYKDGDDDSTINGAGYFTDGVSLGMKVGDILFHFDEATPKGSAHAVLTVSGTTVTLGFLAVA
jgi:hypothetical protein